MKQKDQEKVQKRNEDNVRQPIPPPTPIINEPRPDWVPFSIAPFYCLSDDNLHTEETWAATLAIDVRKLVESDAWEKRGDVPLRPELSGYDVRPAWAIKSTRDTVEIEALSVTTTIGLDGNISIAPASDVSSFWAFMRWNEILEGDWAFPVRVHAAVQWHCHIIGEIIDSFIFNLSCAIDVGAVHLFARKNSVLAPFERIALDQWHYFSVVDDGKTTLTPGVGKVPGKGKNEPAHFAKNQSRIDAAFNRLRREDLIPRYNKFIRQPGGLACAIGPGGERLYSIYAAPGIRIVEKGVSEPEGKCRRWLLEELQRFPKKPPKPLEDLMEMAGKLFPGLSGRGFYRCLNWAQEQTHNLNWSQGGRPSKTRHGISAE